MAQSPNILLVDEDEILLEMVEASIYLHNPEYHVFKAHSIPAALGMLNAHRMNLVITELEFSDGHDVAQFLVGLQKRTPPPMVLALTASSLMSRPTRLRVNAWMPKPPAAEQLLQRIDELVQSTRESVLRGISLESFLQMVSHDRKSCTLTITSGRRVGHLYQSHGNLIHADTEEHQAKAAFLRILSWPDCTIRVSDSCSVMPSIDESLTNLLMDACLYRDRLASGLPTDAEEDIIFP